MAQYGARAHSLLHSNLAQRSLLTSNSARASTALCLLKFTGPSWLPTSGACHVRLVKTRATVKVKDLPQGLLKSAKQTRKEPDKQDEQDKHDKEGEEEEREGEGEEQEQEQEQEGEPSYPTVIQQARNNMRRFENCVLLTRVGSFYELYFEHAEQYGPLLNLKVGSKKTSAGPVPMAGFPFFHLDRFLKTLVSDLNKYVAVSEEFPNNAPGKVKSGGLLFDRKVTRVITPGTLVDEKFINPYENNFLLAIHAIEHTKGNEITDINLQERRSGQEFGIPHPSMSFGVAWLDLSTGQFFTQSVVQSALSSLLVRIAGSEIVMSDDLKVTTKTAIMDALGPEKSLRTSQASLHPMLPVSEWTPMLESAVPEAEQGHFTDEEVLAGALLLNYVKDRLQGQRTKLQAPVRRQEGEAMIIDKYSMRGLEIFETTRESLRVGAKGSLLHAVRRTVTSSGTRLLKDRISSPSTSLQVIDQRLNLVQLMIEDQNMRETVVSLLRRTFDSQRLVQKFSLGRGDADDLVSLLRTINATQTMAESLNRALAGMYNEAAGMQVLCDSLHDVLQRLSLDGPNALSAQISKAIDEDGLMASHEIAEASASAIVSMAQSVLSAEGDVQDLDAMQRTVRTKVVHPGKELESEAADIWIMRKSASPALGKLHQNLAKLFDEKSNLLTDLRERTRASNLTLRWRPGLGHFLHLKGVKNVQASIRNLGATRNVGSSKTTQSFYLPAWTQLGNSIDQTKLQIRAEEQRVFQELREQVVQNLVKLRRNAMVLDELDVACSSATLAMEQGHVRPILNAGTSHKIIGGKHPTVQLGLEEEGRSFISNDCFVGEKEKIWLITGPNMGGKSTFLRQNALISIMAQVGLYVPAEFAEIGIVDQIFSRIGAADNIFQNQSTFMVEMVETAAILKRATPRSFVIMDEVGRGTTPEDGNAVGFACLHHLYHINGCRTLFATHFHALAGMTSDWDQLGQYCTDVVEDDNGSFSYVHRLRPGLNRVSHALKVAKLAGMPEAAMRVAAEVLNTSRPPAATQILGSAVVEAA